MIRANLLYYILGVSDNHKAKFHYFTENFGAYIEHHQQHHNHHYERISPVAPSTGYDSERHLSGTVAVVKPTQQQQQLQEQRNIR